MRLLMNNQNFVIVCVFVLAQPKMLGTMFQDLPLANPYGLLQHDIIQKP